MRERYRLAPPKREANGRRGRGRSSRRQSGVGAPDRPRRRCRVNGVDGAGVEFPRRAFPEGVDRGEERKRTRKEEVERTGEKISLFPLAVFPRSELSGGALNAFSFLPPVLNTLTYVRRYVAHVRHCSVSPGTASTV